MMTWNNSKHHVECVQYDFAHFHIAQISFFENASNKPNMQYDTLIMLVDFSLSYSWKLSNLFQTYPVYGALK